jgi:hypothetical protein
MSMDRNEFITRLQSAHAKAVDGECLGCLLNEAGLRGGHPEGGRPMQGDVYYLTGKGAAHDYIRSQRWLRRVIKASIAELKREGSGQ